MKLCDPPNEHSKQVGSATLSEAGLTSKKDAVRRMHNHKLPCKQGKDLVVIHSVDIADSMKDFAYPYTF